jgi:hypothetical protein
MTSKCDKWIKDPSKNPDTNRKIKSDGPTWKKLKKECSFHPNAGKKSIVKPSQQKLLSSKCDKWIKDPSKNPDTNRKIKLDGPTWKKLKVECGAGPSRKLLKLSPSKSVVKYSQQTHGIASRINNNLSKINVNQWDVCLSGDKTKFRQSLKSAQLIGNGSFGEVYSTVIGDDTVVVKESILRPSETLLLKHTVRKTVGAIPKNSYPEEYELLQLLQTALTLFKSPNFLRVYNIAVCDGCKLANQRQPGSCYLTFMEPADGDLAGLFYNGDLKVSDQYSVLYQLLLAVQVVHAEYGIYHADIKSQNVLFRRIRPGGYFKYSIGPDDFYVENTGLLIYL